MHFTVQKTIIQKKQSPLRGVVNILILIVAIPVIVIAATSLSIYFLFSWLKNKIVKEKIVLSPLDHYHLELDLINNEHIQIILIEDESDIELTTVNEAWQDRVYNEETCLYRTRTIPVVPALEGGISCFYLKEQINGLFLQVLPITGDSNIRSLNTRLLFLSYENLEISFVDETGPFFLYNDDKNEQKIHGFNKEQKISIHITRLS